MPELVAVTLSQKEFKVGVGGTSSAMVTVVNRGVVVDQYSLSVEGLDPGWWEITPPTVSLFPGDEASATLTFHLPSGALAGTHPFRLKAVSADDPSRSASAEATLEVGAAGGLLLSLEPSVISGRSGSCSVRLNNRGNAEARVSLAARDKDETLEYSFEPGVLSVPAFGESEALLKVQPEARPLWGRPVDYGFTVGAFLEGADEPAAEADGEMHYKPLVGAFGLPAGKWRWLLALIPLLALALLIRALQQPGPAAPPTPTVVAAAKPTAAAQPTPQPPAKPNAAGGGAKVAPPTIASFELIRAQPGFALTWKVTGADKVELNGEKVDPEGRRPIQEPRDQGFELKATNAGGTVAKRINALLFPPPVVKSMSAEPPEVYAGQPSVLRWEVTGAERAKMDGKDAMLPRGWLEVRPDATRDYLLSAENAVGWVVQRATVRVLPGDPPPEGLRVYSYNFRDNTDDWELGADVWSRVPWEGGYALKGTNHGFVRLTAHSGSISSLAFRFNLDNAGSGLQANLLETMEGPQTRYFIKFDPKGIEITKQEADKVTLLARKAGEISTGAGHEAKIMVGGGSIDVSLDGEGIIGADDPSPPSGTYASFECLSEPAVYVQNVEVRIGPESEPHPRAPRQ